MTLVEWLRTEAELVSLDRLAEAADEIERLQAHIMELVRDNKHLRAEIEALQRMRRADIEVIQCMRQRETVI